MSSEQEFPGYLIYLATKEKLLQRANDSNIPLSGSGTEAFIKAEAVGAEAVKDDTGIVDFLNKTVGNPAFLREFCKNLIGLEYQNPWERHMPFSIFF